MPIKHVPVLELSVAQSAEYLRLRKRLESIRDQLKALEGKEDDTSKTKRAKLLLDQKGTRAQKKKLKR